MRELCTLIKSYGVYIAFHSCGAVSEVISDFMELGIDILFPIQPKAKGMDAAALKSAFGKNLVFYGGIDVQEILPFGSVSDVRSEVRRVSDIMGREGGYILSSAHTILRDFPVENIVAMYDEGKKPIS